MTTPTARHVLALIAKNLSEHLNDAIWNGVRNAAGDTTADLFDGFDTITEKEIAAGAIAEAEGNYMKIDDEITAANAVDVAKSILFSLDPRPTQPRPLPLLLAGLRRQIQRGLSAHARRHTLQQPVRTGCRSRGVKRQAQILPLYNKAGSKFMHVTTKANMLVGYDQMGDVENVMVKEYAPFILSYIATMFFGVQFETLDKRRFKTVEIAV